jgi:hypothetical protein
VYGQVLMSWEAHLETTVPTGQVMTVVDTLATRVFRSRPVRPGCPTQILTVVQEMQDSIVSTDRRLNRLRNMYPYVVGINYFSNIQ